jgi:hypothetical protein
MPKTHNIDMSNENIRMVAYLQKTGWSMETIVEKNCEEFLLMRKGKKQILIQILKRTEQQN